MSDVISELTGQPADTSSEEWRHECECRWILDNIKTREQRREHLKKLALKRGQAAADRVKETSLTLFNLRQQRRMESR